MLDRIRTVLRPSTLPEALQLLSRGDNSPRIIAGGTDLLVEDSGPVHTLVDIMGLDLAYIREGRRHYRLGAATSITAIAESRLTRNHAQGLIAKAAGTWGSTQISNVATLGGNLVHGSPAADMAPPLLALRASALMRDSRGKRLVPLENFWRGCSETVIGRGLLLEIQVPRPTPGNRLLGSFQKLIPMGGKVAIASVAIALDLDYMQKCQTVGIALGALGPAPIRARVAERVLVGGMLKASVFEGVCTAVAQCVAPVNDFRASAEYRREMSRILTRRALEEILAQVHSQ